MTDPARRSTTRRATRFAVVGIALALGVLAGGCSGTTPSPAPATPALSPAASVAVLPLEVDVAGAVALRDSGALVIDVREPDEWAAGHIQGATLIPLGQLGSRASELPRGRDIVVVCRSGNRSAKGRDVLLGAGFGRVTSMAGGMTDWVTAGQPVVTGS